MSCVTSELCLVGNIFIVILLLSSLCDSTAEHTGAEERALRFLDNLLIH